MLRARRELRRPLNIHKRLPVLRSANDEVYDETGTLQNITEEDLSRDLTGAGPRKKLNIPIPVIKMVAGYDEAMMPDFVPPSSYIRRAKKTAAETNEALEYCLEECDMIWLEKLHSMKKTRGMLDEDKLEMMLDTLEKATGLNPVLSQEQAENMLTTRLGMQPTSASREIVADVYQYWIEKRGQYQKPLLRRFWPVTSTDDTNPHLVFRPREKERYKLRKHRKNDMDSFRKMQQLRRDCERVRNLLDLVRHREKIKLTALNANEEMFEHQMHDFINPGSTRSPKHDLERLHQQLSAPPLSELESDRPAKRMKGAKKNRKRPQMHLDGDTEFDYDEEDDGGTLSYGNRGRDGVPDLRDGMDESMAEKSRQKSIRAAIPSFMEAFPARSSYVLSSVFAPSTHTFTQDTRMPPFTTGSEPEEAHSVSYSCRGRIGRGGRIVFDRIGNKESSLSSQPTILRRGVGRDCHTGPHGTIGVCRQIPADMKKLWAVYDLSDSEDEEIKQSAPSLLAPGQAAAPTVAIKFELVI